MKHYIRYRSLIVNEKKRVFIAEDDLLSAEYLKQILQKAGYEVSGVADNAEETIEECKRSRPDAILMDIMLKGRVTGTEAALEISRTLPSCKIIFITAYAEKEMIEYAEMSKAYAYLMKPYREKEILATIELLAKNKNSTVSNEQICLEVWSEIKSDNTLRSLIHRFRNAVGDDIITNVNGVGYTVTA